MLVSKKRSFFNNRESCLVFWWLKFRFFPLTRTVDYPIACILYNFKQFVALSVLYVMIALSKLFKANPGRCLGHLRPLRLVWCLEHSCSTGDLWDKSSSWTKPADYTVILPFTLVFKQGKWNHWWISPCSSLVKMQQDMKLKFSMVSLLTDLHVNLAVQFWKVSNKCPFQLAVDPPLWTLTGKSSIKARGGSQQKWQPVIPLTDCDKWRCW